MHCSWQWDIGEGGSLHAPSLVQLCSMAYKQCHGCMENTEHRQALLTAMQTRRLCTGKLPASAQGMHKTSTHLISVSLEASCVPLPSCDPGCTYGRGFSAHRGSALTAAPGSGLSGWGPSPCSVILCTMTVTLALLATAAEPLAGMARGATTKKRAVVPLRSRIVIFVFSGMCTCCPVSSTSPARGQGHLVIRSDMPSGGVSGGRLLGFWLNSSGDMVMLPRKPTIGITFSGGSTCKQEKAHAHARCGYASMVGLGMGFVQRGHDPAQASASSITTAAVKALQGARALQERAHSPR